MGLRSPVGAFPPDDIPNAPDMSEQDENHLGTDEESSKESSLQSSLQDSSLTELEGKVASTTIGGGTFMQIWYQVVKCNPLSALNVACTIREIP